MDEILSSFPSHPDDTHPTVRIRIEALGLEADKFEDDVLNLDPHSSSACLVSELAEIEEELTLAFHHFLLETGLTLINEDEK